MVSAREKEMERILSRRGRSRRFKAVIAQMSSEASAVLDLGCGTGALAASLVERWPSVVVVGIDRSRFLLSKLQRRRIALTVLGGVSTLPFRDEVFDVAIAVQVLHEIIAADGSELLAKTLRNIRRAIRQGGELVIFDHLSPGEAPVSLRLSDEMLTRLSEFQAKFQFRRIDFHDYGDGLVTMSRRDFYDFSTKIWALNSDLEEEEMNETHAPFTRREIGEFLERAGFKVERTRSLTSVGSRKGIMIQSKGRLPQRHIVVLAKKHSV